MPAVNQTGHLSPQLLYRWTCILIQNVKSETSRLPNLRHFNLTLTESRALFNLRRGKDSLMKPSLKNTVTLSWHRQNCSAHTFESLFFLLLPDQLSRSYSSYISADYVLELFFFHELVRLFSTFYPQDVDKYCSTPPPFPHTHTHFPTFLVS